MGDKPWQKWMLAGIVLMIFGMFVSAGILWDALPEQMPAHYNAQGELDRYGGRETVLVPSIISAVLSAIIYVVTRHPKTWNMPAGRTKAHYALTRSVLYWICFLMICLFCTMYISKVWVGSLSMWFLALAPVTVFAPLIVFFVRSRRIPNA